MHEMREELREMRKELLAKLKALRVEIVKLKTEPHQTASRSRLKLVYGGKSTPK